MKNSHLESEPMKTRSESPRTVEHELVDLGVLIRQMETLRQNVLHHASNAHEREEAAEARLHLVHNFLHVRLHGIHEEGHKNGPSEYRAGYADAMRDLAEVLGYRRGEPDRFDVQTWIDADKPTPARQTLGQVREQRVAQTNGATTALGSHYERFGVQRLASGNNDHEHDGS